MKLCEKTRCVMPADRCYHSDQKKRSFLRNADNILDYSNLVNKYIHEIVDNLSDEELTEIICKIKTKNNPFKQQTKMLTNEFYRRENDIDNDCSLYDENICECCGQYIDY